MIRNLKRFTVPAAVIAVAVFSTPFLYSEYLQFRDARANPFAEEFPVSVDPIKKTIVEDERVAEFFEEEKFHLLGMALFPSEKLEEIFSGFAVSLAQIIGEENFAAVSGEKLVTIPAGLRKEEVAAKFARALKWSEKEKKEFLTMREGENLPLTEGSFFPGVYAAKVGATPLEVQAMVNERFRENILARYSTSTAKVIPLNTALTIASLIQRETLGTDDMRLVSGIIWNRIFANMNLQLDATLQYARASINKGSVWWPQVRSQDKFIKSPYNTYRNKGLPPAPIANPSIAAMLAALNPVKTDCLFYFHDKKGGIYCSPTYEGHVAMLKKIYGRGK